MPKDTKTPTLNVRVGVLSELFGVQDRRIQGLATDGIIPKPDRGVYELYGAVKGYIAFLKERSVAESGGGDLNSEKTRLTKAQADIAEIEAAKASGEVAPVAQIEKAWANFCAETRVKARNIPDRVVSLIVGCTDEREIKAVLLREIDQVLIEMADADATVDTEEPTDEQV